MKPVAMETLEQLVSTEELVQLATQVPKETLEPLDKTVERVPLV